MFFERLQTEAYRYGIFADRNEQGNIFLSDIEGGWLLCDSWGLVSVEEAYERLEELTKDQEPEMSVDEAEKGLDDYLEYLEEKRGGED